MDDPDCDSTWEEDEDAEAEEGGREADAGDADAEDEDAGDEDARPGALQSRMTASRNWRAMQDMRRYRHHYPDLVEQDCNGDMSNLSFYKNEIRFQPNGCFIEDILQNWRDNYELLEDNHSYIQWLFPLREPGVNWHAKPLTLKEVEAFKSSAEVKERFVRAYELMLGFYGIQLEDHHTGAVGRAQNYQQRFQNLNWRSHNNLRITRILKSLGELGLEHYQAPLARFFLEETLVRRELPGVRQSALDYFLFAVRCRRQRRELVHFAWQHFRPRCKFVWGPWDKLRRFRPHTLLPGPGEPLWEVGTQGQACRDPTANSVEAVEAGREDEATPPSPKETKKRKLEANRQEPAPEEPVPPSPSEVEKIALNLQGCALSQGSRDISEAEQPCALPEGLGVVDETRKRRKVEEGAGGHDGGAASGSPHMLASAPSECPEAQNGGTGVEKDPESQVEAEQGAAGPPSEGPGSTGASVDGTEMGPSADPREP